MPRVTFLPSGAQADVAPGTSVIDAARRAGVMIDLPCGGKGTCGKCLVRVTAGSVESKQAQRIAGQGSDDGFVNACLSSIISDVTVTIPDSMAGAGESCPDDAIDTAGDQVLGTADLSPLSMNVHLNVARPEPEDGLSDLDRTERSLGSVLQGHEIRWPLSVIRRLADALREQDGKVTLTLAFEGRANASGKLGKSDPAGQSADCGSRGSRNPGNAETSESLSQLVPTKAGTARQAGHPADISHVIDIRSGHAARPNLGIAVDLGTTTISVQLVDLANGRVISRRNGYNEQIRCGLDVISRINYASNHERLDDIRSRAVHSINRLIAEAVQTSRFHSHDIACCRISGNTVMTHLFLGLKPEYIRLDPYTPTVMEIPPLTAQELGIDIHPNALVSLSPCVGSYVGGDVTAGLLVADLVKDTEEVSLFIDIGTNGEIVLGNRDFLMTCACSAGPAFEGGGIDCGMRATTGAIDRVTIDPDTGKAQYTVIGEGEPSGICGSGLIDLIAGLFITGWIDSSGRLGRTKASPFIRTNGRRASYIVAEDRDAKDGKTIAVSENDIENLMRAKAAIYSAASLLIKQTGLTFEDLAEFSVAGGFGKYLDLQNAVTIGLLPEIPLGKFRYLGNASLSGTRLCLLSEEFRNIQAEISRRMTYIDLSTFPGYMDQYTAALFLPHTDLEQFPKVMERMLRGGS